MPEGLDLVEEAFDVVAFLGEGLGEAMVNLAADLVGNVRCRAGDLGYTVLFAISTYQFEKATTAIILLILLITAIDRFCLVLRKKVA